MLDSKEATSNPVNETALTPEVSYNIVHAIPGRIRFSIPKLATDSSYADKVKALLESDSNVTDVRLNAKAASIAISYKSDPTYDDQIRAHLVNIIQDAPKQAPVKQATTKSVVAAILDAIVNLIDSLRNVNKARKGITEGEYKTDFWERALKGTKSITKKLGETILFILPKRQLTTQNKADK
ncbi:hypothetical protein NIES4071_02340 [Calothrix sp. NIES-4071]|nr:hypothetical protein NIES4071_02340 [Calothrix sp. NIES-4071]BAZ54580.1 hypothetical protein NIES4105_02330 [Calothrix sp. NIES-4105]